VVPLLVERKLLERLDRATFACYCLAWQELYDAQCLIKHELAQCEALVKLDVPTHLEGLDRDRFIEAQKKAAKVIAGRGCTGYNRFGEEVRSAAAQITAAAEKRVREFSIEFGLTTRSRGLATTGGGTDDADDAPEFPLELHDAPAHTPGA
jgi:phage terminase small subunit